MLRLPSRFAPVILAFATSWGNRPSNGPFQAGAPGLRPYPDMIPTPRGSRAVCP